MRWGLHGRRLNLSRLSGKAAGWRREGFGGVGERLRGLGETAWLWRVVRGVRLTPCSRA
jgi:hypothetical protein